MAPRFGTRVTLLCVLWLLCQHTVYAQQGEAKLGTPITAVPCTISAPGVYVLTQDFPNLNVATGAAIQITASDVVLDLNGHTLNNTAAGSATTAYGILALDQSNVTVRNGNVQGFMSGVALVASDPTVSPSPSYGNLVEAMAVSACTYEGIALSGGSSVVRRSEVAQIGGSTLAGDYTSAYGIDLVGAGLRCLDCDVAAVTASGPAGGSYAIYVTGSADAFVLDNRLSGMQYGIYFDETSATGQYRRNLASGISGQAYVGGTDAGENIVDSNGDGIDDDWELAYFGTLNLDLAALAPSGSGLTILQSYQQGLNPDDFYNGQSPSILLVSGSGQSAAPGSFVPAPLVVQVNDPNGNPLSGAPVTFTVVSGGGQFQASRQASPKSTLSVLTDANGQAQAFFQVAGTAGVTSSISAAPTATTASPAAFQETADSNGAVNPTPTGPAPDPDPEAPNNPPTVPVQSYACIDISGTVQGNNNIRAVALDDTNTAAFAFSSATAPLPGDLGVYFGVPDGNAEAYTWSNGQLSADKYTDLTVRTDVPEGPPGASYNYNRFFASLASVDINGTVYGSMYNMYISTDGENHAVGQIACLYSSNGSGCSPITLPSPFVYADDSGNGGGLACVSPQGWLIGSIASSYANSFPDAGGAYLYANGQYTVFDEYDDFTGSTIASNLSIQPYAFSPCIVNNKGAALGASWDGSGGYTTSLWTNALPAVPPVPVGEGYPTGLNDQNQVIDERSSSEGYLWENGTTTVLVNHLPAELVGLISYIQPFAISNQANPGTDATIYILAKANVTQPDGTVTYGATIVCTRDNEGTWSFAQVQVPDGTTISYSNINSSGIIACIDQAASDNASDAYRRANITPMLSSTPSNKHAKLRSPVNVTSVSFSGDKYWQIESDDAATKYSAPQWADANKKAGTLGWDAKASDPKEHDNAVAYTMNSTPKIGATFKVPGASKFKSVMFKADGPDDISIPATAGTVGSDGKTVTMATTLSVGPLPNTIKFYNKADNTAFFLEWQISVDGGITWSAIDTTVHTVYATFADPLTSARQETIFYVGCENQGTQTDPASIANTIFGEFTSMNLCRVGTTAAMSYWGTWASSVAAQSSSPDCFSTAGLLKKGDGRCGAWANFLVDLLSAQGLGNAQVETINPIGVPASGLTGYSILVNNWDLSSLSNPVKLQGVPGQGNSNPQAQFSNHALVSFMGTLYDPSYGKQYSNRQEWEDAALAAIILQDGSSNLYIQAHTFGVQQTTMTP